MKFKRLNLKIKNHSTELREFKNELASLKSEYSEVNHILENLKKEKGAKTSELKKLQQSHSIQNTLKALPYFCDGSIYFHNELNKSYSKYNQNQFNKITRFLDLISQKEEEYNEKYKRVFSNYLINPNFQDLNSIINQIKTIHTFYSLLNILVSEVNGDVVLFNKTYNLIEDEGIFLTKSEKESIEYLKKIFKQINNLNKDLNKGLSELNNNLKEIEKSINVGFSKVNTHLKNIDSNLDSVSDSLFDVTEKLYDINYNIGEVNKSVQGGNFLNAVQVFQLYKINNKLNR